MRWEAISQAMLNFGIQEKWTRQACQAKWESLTEHELAMVKEELDWSPTHQYDDRYSPDGSCSSVTPDSLRGGSRYGEGLGVSPSQLLLPNGGGHDGFPDPRTRYPSQHGWTFVT